VTGHQKIPVFFWDRPVDFARITWRPSPLSRNKIGRHGDGLDANENFAGAVVGASLWGWDVDI
jgi:hypothetical protein